MNGWRTILSWQIEQAGPIPIPLDLWGDRGLPTMRSWKSTLYSIINSLDTADQDTLVGYLYNDRGAAIRDLNLYLQGIIENNPTNKRAQIKELKEYTAYVYLCNWINKFGTDPTFLRTLDRVVKDTMEPSHGAAPWNLIL